MSHAEDSWQIEPGHEEHAQLRKQELGMLEELRRWLFGSPQRRMPCMMSEWQLLQVCLQMPVHKVLTDDCITYWPTSDALVKLSMA